MRELENTMAVESQHLIGKRHKLFDKLKAKGIFWSYDDTVLVESIGDNIFIEHTLKYGDFDDLVEIFSLYNKQKLLHIWGMELKSDMRFKKLNLMLARVFWT